jgi:hypothetical protein
VTDLENDPLAAAFDEFRSAVSPMVRTAGADRTREIVHSRKRNQTIALGALVALVVAIPVVVAITVGGGPPKPPAVTPLPSGSGGFMFPNPVGRYHPPTTAPPGGISVAELNDAKLDLLSWAPDAQETCPTGPIKFTHGSLSTATGERLSVDSATYVDVDHDGRFETIARVLCGGPGSELATAQVLALKRDGSSGIRTLGQVTTPTGTVTNICGVRAGSDGTIQVQVIDFPILNGCIESIDTRPRYITKQWRTFAWTGSGFVQSAGPTTFPPNPYASDLALTGTDLTLVRQPNGHYRGEMTLTIRNLGTATMSYRTDTVISTGMRAVASSGGCTVTTQDAGGGMEDVYCAGKGLRGGSRLTITLAVDAPRRTTLAYVPDTNVLTPDNFGDPNDGNNRAALQIRFQN